MSGPITVVVTANPAAALLAAAAISAATAIQQGMEAADRLADAHGQARRDKRALQAAAASAGREGVAQAIAQGESRFERLLGLAEPLGLSADLERLRLAPASAGDMVELLRYAQHLEALCDRVEDILEAEAQKRRASSAELPTDLTLPAARQTLVQRLLARITHLGEVPVRIAQLADELQHSAPGERATLLATSLRFEVQQLLEAAEKRDVQEATAVIVGKTLQDLGYQLEEVGHTLFVEGGVVHFRRPGWGNYMVRMRVQPQGQTVNFNVVRAVEAGENERSVLDHLAEDRWCAEFPALLKALAQQGVQFDVTRRLEAGELPVQLVERSRLPSFADDEERQAQKHLQARKNP